MLQMLQVVCECGSLLFERSSRGKIVCVKCRDKGCRVYINDVIQPAIDFALEAMKECKSETPCIKKPNKRFCKYCRNWR